MGARATLWDPAVKAAAISAILAGKGLAETGRMYQIPVSTLHGWRVEAQRMIFKDKSPDLENAYDWAPTYQPDVRVAFSSYLAEAFHALRVQMALFSNPEYLARQPIDAVVAAHGVVADRVARIAEGIGQLDSGNAPPPAPVHALAVVPEFTVSRPTPRNYRHQAKLAKEAEDSAATQIDGLEPDWPDGQLEGTGRTEGAPNDASLGETRSGLTDLPDEPA